ncbi:MAG TPA: hypothetical protein VKY45_08160 [Marinilabiliaceae bacterium]|nr:hypothetical protein [Marinilabiliaceae bacterium]
MISLSNQIIWRITVLPEFKFFKSHPGIWRMDGVGQLRLIDSKPHATVCFSGLHPESLIPNNTFFQRSLPASAIVWLAVGSLWKSGRRIKDNTLERETFTVDVSKPEIFNLQEKLSITLKTNKNIEVGILPPNAFNFGGGKGNYNFLKEGTYRVFKTGSEKTPYLIIPSSEIYRFYYGVSSRLCNSIIVGETDKYVDWSLSERGANPKIHLKTRLSRLERYVFLRALADDDAMKSLFNIRSMIESKSVQEKEVFIDADFPFKKRTNLSVRGKRICLVRKTDATPAVHAFFAMQILTCAYAPNIDESIVVFGNEEFRAKEGSSAGRGEGDSFDDFLGDMEDIDELFEFGDTGADVREKRISLLTPSARFPAMASISYKFIRSDGSIDACGARFDKDEKSSQYAIGEGDSSEENSDIRGVDKNISEHQVSRDIEKFIEVMKAFSSMNKPKNWKVNFLSNTEELNSGGELLSIFPNMGKRYSWCLIKQPDSNDRRRRHVVWVQVTLEDNRKIYLVELELRPEEHGWSTAIWVPTSEKGSLEAEDLNQLLRLTAIKNRWPKLSHKWPNEKLELLVRDLFERSIIYRMEHPSNTTVTTDGGIQTWAEQITEKIISLEDEIFFK